MCIRGVRRSAAPACPGARPPPRQGRRLTIGTKQRFRTINAIRTTGARWVNQREDAWCIGPTMGASPTSSNGVRTRLVVANQLVAW